jgi:hypothetical protein
MPLFQIDKLEIGLVNDAITELLHIINLNYGSTAEHRDLNLNG